MPVLANAFAVWSVDSLDRVPQDAEPPQGADRIVLEACRNEYASAQVGVRAARALRDLRMSIAPLKSADGATGVEVTARFVGYVPVTKNTSDTPAEELSCTAPCRVPDPLLPDETIAVEAGAAQPVWLTIFVPPDASAGRWQGALQVSAEGETAEIPIELTVFPVAIPSKRHLWVTNWMNMHNFAKHYATEMRSPRFWQVVESFAHNMAAHRQNVTCCPFELVSIIQEPDGRLSFEYADLDRWVDTFTRAGCMELIEGGALGRRGEGKWETPWFEWREFKVVRRDGAAVKPEREAVVEALVKSVVRHMKEKGWFDRFIMHVVDEPAPHTEADYKKKSALVHEWAPGVRFLEAMSLLDARGFLDIWVPNLDHFTEHMDHYLGLRREAGFELWFYTCMFPTGLYPNRFLDFSLVKTRILHWLNWRYRLTGYLHWGLNFWTDDPFNEDRIREDLPPGDCWIVYPGKEGPLDSLRWEQMREGLQDFELLRLLDEQARERAVSTEKADQICAGLVRSPQDYAHTPAELRAARRAAIDALAAM